MPVDYPMPALPPEGRARCVHTHSSAAGWTEKGAMMRLDDPRVRTAPTVPHRRPADRRLMHGLESVPNLYRGSRCLFRKWTTTRGYETGTLARALGDTRGHRRHSAKHRFAGKTCPRVPGRAREYRPKTSMVRRGVDGSSPSEGSQKFLLISSF
jgi:hypothetical protein